MDYAPIVYDTLDKSVPTPLEEIVYNYLESELPVILVLRLPYTQHVCLVIGHDFKHQVNPRKISEPIRKNSDYIHHLIVHDDDLGPYLRMPIDDNDVKNANFFGTEDPVLFRTSYTTPYSFNKNVFAAIVPSFRKIYIEGDNVEFHITNILTAQNPIFSDQLLPSINDPMFLQSLSEGRIIIRTFFISSNDYKDKIVQIDTFSSQLKQFYLNMKFPKFIWVTEISTLDHALSPNKYERKIIGEIICDSTTSANLPHIFLSIHLPGVLALRYPNLDNNIQLYEIQDDKPYSSHVR